MKRKIYWGLTLLIVVPILAIIAINLFDEKLDPEAAAWGEPRPVTVPEAENGYYALLAATAPEGADGMAHARAWVNEARAAAREGRPEKQAVVKRSKRADTCDPVKVSCLDAARDKQVELTTALEAYKEDLVRYRALLASKRYEEVLDFPLRMVSGIPMYGVIAGSQRAWLTQAALAAEAGDLEAAVAAVEADLAFQRVMLTGARTLIGKMVASARYWASLAFAADLSRQKSAALEPFAPRLRAALADIDPAALKMDAAMESEFGALKRAFNNPDEVAAAAGESSVLPRVASKLLYQPNATINRFYRQYRELAAALNQHPAEIPAAGSKLTQTYDTSIQWDYIVNPIGKILMTVAIPNMGSYALRMHDLNAFNRLVALRVEALAANVAAEQAPEFTTKAEARFNDPYTSKPFTWDAAKKRWQFKPLHATDKQSPANVDGDGAFVVF